MQTTPTSSAGQHELHRITLVDRRDLEVDAQEERDLLVELVLEATLGRAHDLLERSGRLEQPTIHSGRFGWHDRLEHMSEATRTHKTTHLKDAHNM